ncbi:MAG: F0F1 ATP synthase subunit epsilon [Chloroflexi bacterium]|nr:F0F1 ATP synthase subunit epsilon [Chloroflexota bacterium]
MATIRVEVVAVERVVYADDVDAVIAPGVGGQLGILPHHAPLMTALTAGELRIKKGGEEEVLVVSGGFLEVRPDKVIVLADAAERAEEIDIARAEEAKRRAEQRLAEHAADVDTARNEAALRRAIARLAVAERVKTRRRL